MTWTLDKKTVILGCISGGLLVAGLMLLLTQMQFGWLILDNPISKRVFTISCYVLVSSSFIPIMLGQIKKALTYSGITFVVLCAFSFFTGVGLDMLENSGTDFGVVISDPYFVLDALGGQVASWVPVLKTIFAMVPGVVVVIMILMLIAGDGPDEYVSVIIEFALVIVALVVFGIVGKYAGFGWS